MGRSGRAGRAEGAAAEATAAEATAAGSQDRSAGRVTLEVELKYRLRSLATGERILAAGSLAGLTARGPVRTIPFEDRYVDTASGALATAGFAARLRTTPERRTISLKSMARRPGGEPGPHRREELEGPAHQGDRPRMWPPSNARSVVLEVCGDAPLVELVTIRQRRRRRLLVDQAAAVELSLDAVEVGAWGAVVDRWVELEVELIRGDERRLLDVAAALDARGDLEPVRASKLETALAAAGRAGH